jgi:lysylphosphatidylglycerol synthetase-like protein (DUF2156 family)
VPRSTELRARSACGLGSGKPDATCPTLRSWLLPPSDDRAGIGHVEQEILAMNDLPLILAGIVAVIAIVLAIVSGLAWLIIAAGAIAAAVVIYMRRQRA